MMPLQVLEPETEKGTVRPPWEIAPFGVVSLLAMLEFAACDFLRVSQIFGEVIGRAKSYADQPPADDMWGDSLSRLITNCQHLGLTVTYDHLMRLVQEVAQTGSVQVSGERWDLKGGLQSWERTQHHAELLYSTLQSELRQLLFVAVPRERVNYRNPGWLQKTEIPNNFPTSIKELQRAGSCFSLGEATACVFHSMRALEPALNAMAQEFNVPFTHDNWQVIIEQIESRVRDLGKQAKSPQKIADEKFFGAATSHLYFVKNAWRNHVTHQRETYSDTEAHRIMESTVQFIESLCPRLNEYGL